MSTACFVLIVYKLQKEKLHQQEEQESLKGKQLGGMSIKLGFLGFELSRDQIYPEMSQYNSDCLDVLKSEVSEITSSEKEKVCDYHSTFPTPPLNPFSHIMGFAITLSSHHYEKYEL